MTDDEKPNILRKYDIVTNPEGIYQVCLAKDEYKNKVYYKEAKNHYYLDFLKSCCLEFSIGGFYPYRENELHSSRYYYIFEYYDKNASVRKNEDFINWAD